MPPEAPNRIECDAVLYGNRCMGNLIPPLSIHKKYANANLFKLLAWWCSIRPSEYKSFAAFARFIIGYKKQHQQVFTTNRRKLLLMLVWPIQTYKHVFFGNKSCDWNAVAGLQLGQLARHGENRAGRAGDERRSRDLQGQELDLWNVMQTAKHSMR